MTDQQGNVPSGDTDVIDLDAVVDGFGDLATLAPVAVEVIQVTEDERSSIGDVVKVISRDPGLAARMLRTANSAMYGQSREVTNLDRATAILGLRMVKLLSLGFTMVTTLDDRAISGLWRRSLAGSVLARSLCEAAAPQLADEAFTAGLLGDVGKLALAGVPAYDEVLERQPWPETEVEIRALGFSSDSASARILEGWGLPQILVQAVDSRDRPASDDGSAEVLSRILHVVRYATGLVTATDAETQALELEALNLAAEAHLGLSATFTEAVIQQAQPALWDIGQMFDLGELTTGPVSQIMADAQQQLARLSLDLASTLAQQHHEAEQITEDNRRLSEQATTDALTSLANRRGFDDFVGTLLVGRDSSGPSLTLGLVLIDLDHFKSINDTHGHQVGDEVLAEVGRRLRKSTRMTEFVARVGGEEFALVMPATNPAEMDRAGTRFCSLIRDEPFETAAGSLNVTASVGGAHARRIDAPGFVDALYQVADAALYRAKGQGRDRFIISSGS